MGLWHNSACISYTQHVLIVLSCLAACMVAWMIASLWRDIQCREAARRVYDRLEQEEAPEGQARRQARRAHEAALVTEALAAMRRASWGGLLQAWVRRTDPVQA